MKILLVNHRYFMSGGPERYMFGVTRLLEQAGHTVIPFSIRYSQNVASDWSDYFVSPISGEDAIYFRDHSRTPRSVLTSLERVFYSREVYRALTRLVRAEKPDVALVLHYLRKLSPSVLDALRDGGVPIVVRLSDFGMVCPQQHLVRAGRTCDLCVTGRLWPSVRYRCVQGSFAASAVNASAMTITRCRHSFDAVGRFIAPSSAMREKMMAGGFGPDRIVHLPTFVAMEPGVGDNERRQRRVAYVGRLEPVKGVDVLVDAFGRLTSRPGLRDLRLTIVGDDATPEAERIKRRIAAGRIANVEFEGRLDEAGVARVLRTSLLSVVPTVWHENLPNSLLESLACGTPVVGSRDSSIAEALGGSQAGALFARGDAEDLGRVLADLLADTERLGIMSRAALELAETRFSPSRHLEGLLQSFEAARGRGHIAAGGSASPVRNAATGAANGTGPRL